MDNFLEVMQSRIIHSIPEIAVYFFEQVFLASSSYDKFLDLEDTEREIHLSRLVRIHFVKTLSIL